MRRERQFDVNNDYSELNQENPLLRNLRACMKIAPKDGRTVKIGRHSYSSSFPRIVQTNFKVPGDWVKIEVVEDGQELAPGVFHSCRRSRRSNETYNGYYVTTVVSSSSCRTELH